MRPPFLLASVLCGLLMSLTARGEVTSRAEHSRHGRLEIQVDENGWGAVNRQDIRTVLYSVADVLLGDMPGKPPITIRVSHTDSNPVALYQRGPGGEYQIRLHADRERWHLYVYEFAHELCHILSNHDRAGADTRRRNQWLEETLCETASLYALGALGVEWGVAPPEPRFANQAASLRQYFRKLVTEGHRRLPEEVELEEWLREHEARLCDDPYQRDANDLVAKTMLPLFFAEPGGWDAVSYLNLHPDDASASLDDFLTHWYANAPERDRHFVAKLATLLVGHAAVPQESTVPGAVAAAGR